ncbi:MAG: hypothetical protein U1F66_04745 [bacterium]
MKTILGILFLTLGLGGLPEARAVPAHLPPHCDPWLHPRPQPTPPPPGIGDFTAPDPGPATPPPVPSHGQVSFAYGDCGEVPTPSPSPSPTPKPTPPVTPPPGEPQDPPKQDFDPGLPFLEGSGKLGCSLNTWASGAPRDYGMWGLGLALALFLRRQRRGL